MSSSNGPVEPFPTTEPGVGSPPSNDVSDHIVNRPAASSSLSGRLRRVSQSFEESNLPEGFLAATGSIASSILSHPAAATGRSGSLSGASSTAQQTPAGDSPSRHNTFPPVVEEATQEGTRPTDQASTKAKNVDKEPAAAVAFDNGYHFPPSHTFSQSMALGLRSFWNYFLTPLGFLVTLYGLNVVAWGGMLFLLLW